MGPFTSYHTSSVICTGDGSLWIFYAALDNSQNTRCLPIIAVLVALTHRRANSLEDVGVRIATLRVHRMGWELSLELLGGISDSFKNVLSNLG